MSEMPLSLILNTIALESYGTEPPVDSEVITDEGGLALSRIAYMSGDSVLSISINEAEVQAVLNFRMQSVLDMIEEAETQAKAHRAIAPLDRLSLHRTVKDLESAYAAVRSLFLDLHRANAQAISRGKRRLAEQITHKIHLLLWLDRSHYTRFTFKGCCGSQINEHCDLYHHLLHIKDPRTAYLWLCSGEQVSLNPADPKEYMGITDSEVTDDGVSEEKLVRVDDSPAAAFWAKYDRLASRKIPEMSEKEREYKELFDELFIRDRVAQVRVHGLRSRATSEDGKAKPDHIDWSHDPWGEDTCVGCGRKKKVWADRSRGICTNCGRSLVD